MSETDFRDPSAPKSPAIPQFFTEAVKLEWKSRQEGRPIFEDREFVRIIIPGDRRSMAVEPVGDGHKQRWPAEYQAFTAGREAPLQGTPLSEWPVSLMGPARVQELAYFNLRTVEQMAAVNDAQLQNLGMGARELRERARTWLEVAEKGAAPIERLISRNEELARETERLTRELKAANAELSAIRKKESRDAGVAA
ncbi:MAG TPA: hypothetical protein VIJ94_19465 [Caulobacteraceae bacterium]